MLTEPYSLITKCVMLISAALWVCFGRMNRYFKGVCVDTRVHGAKVGKWPPLVMTAKSQYSDQLLRTSKGKYCTQSVTLLFWTKVYISGWLYFFYIFTKHFFLLLSSVKRKSNSSAYWPTKQTNYSKPPNIVPVIGLDDILVCHEWKRQTHRLPQLTYQNHRVV